MQATYSDRYTLKVNQLEQAINEVTNQPTYFKVFNYEAGFGKSREMIRIVEESLSDLDSSNRYLIVKRFSRDVDEAAAYLDHHNNALKLDVVGLTKENWGSEWKNNPDKLVNVRVLIITHQRYINLCLDDELRECFTLNRNILIIDEKVSFPTYSFSKKLYDEVRGYLDSSIQSELDKVCKKMNAKLEEYKLDKKENTCLRTRVRIHPNTLVNFMSLMEANRNIPSLKTLSRVQRNNLETMIKGLPLWYSNNNIYNNGNISTFDQRHHLWGLDNNIILDASAGIDGAYNSKDIFTVVGQERLIDHSNSLFTIVDFNSSKSNLRLNEDDFYPEICKMIKERHSTADKTLILCHKENAERIELTLHRMEVNSIGVDDKYTNQEYAINWFGNLVGRNDYSDFTQCWILGTPNIPYEQYLLKYMIYNNSDLGRKSLDLHSGRFKNNEFRSNQMGYIAAELYQSIKRIQRNEMPSGQFFLVNNDSEIVETVLGQIKGSGSREYLNLEFEEKRTSTKVVAPDRVERLIEYLKSLPSGKYQKNEIAKVLEFSGSNFSSLFKDSRFIALDQTGCIKLFTRYILVR
ncbi:hypothetical protein [Paenibacillus sp. PL91]|uniref:hypothetical protein n=1 Tax=Paenibacillus sp. PL91 TaxID=2729538 RepID=UPI00145DAE94|nr:hypothetical protein [Paenibacillus sp. PL91]MBC9199805.1 hypothetical protein [Paenibacillus sp. PL91]